LIFVARIKDVAKGHRALRIRIAALELRGSVASDPVFRRDIITRSRQV